MSNSKYETVLCSGCGNNFKKERKYITAANKTARKHFCSLSCQMTFRNKTDKRFKHSENLKKGHNKSDELSPFRFYFRKAKSRNKCNLTLLEIKEQWISQNSLCALSGIEIRLNGQNETYFDLASLDRIDSSKPYQKGNIQFVCLPLNLAKNTQTNDEFKKFLEKIKSI